MYENPLTTSEWSKYLTLSHPKDAFTKGLLVHQPEEEDLENFVRSWIAEGVPQCFEKNAMLYEKIRAFIADRLEIKPEDIRCCGSAKVGFSLSPKKPLNDFSAQTSDLDFFLISREFFDRLVGDLRSFLEYYENEEPVVGARIKENIDSNIQTLCRPSGQISRGFIDSNKIPYLKRKIFGPNLQACNEALADLVTLLEQEEIDFPYGGKKITLRTYKDYESAIRQNRISVQAFINAL